MCDLNGFERQKGWEETNVSVPLPPGDEIGNESRRHNGLGWRNGADADSLAEAPGRCQQSTLGVSEAGIYEHLITRHAYDYRSPLKF